MFFRFLELLPEYSKFLAERNLTAIKGFDTSCHTPHRNLSKYKGFVNNVSLFWMIRHESVLQNLLSENITTRNISRLLLEILTEHY